MCDGCEIYENDPEYMYHDSHYIDNNNDNTNQRNLDCEWICKGCRDDYINKDNRDDDLHFDNDGRNLDCKFNVIEYTQEQIDQIN